MPSFDPASLARRAMLALVPMIAFAAEPASAHHMMDGRLPQTFVQGLLSGLGHPVIGLDHFAAILGAGIVAALIGRGFAPVLAFTTAMIAGVMLHVMRADIPAAELLVGLSTAAIGLVILLRSGFGLAAAAILFALTGAVHGYALGESIVGAENTPLGAYLAGLLVIQTLVAAVAFLATRIAMRAHDLGRWSLRIAGSAIVLIGGATVATAAGVI